LPPGVAQSWPVTVQSAAVQQVPLAMQMLEAVQTICPVGQEQTPAAQVSPAFGQTRGG
jgi:hypothetical protein